MSNLNSAPALLGGEWNLARLFRAETGRDFRYTLNLRRGTQGVRERPEKPSYASSLLARAPKISPPASLVLFFSFPPHFFPRGAAVLHQRPRHPWKPAMGD